MLEKEVEAKIVAYAKSRGVLSYKFSSPQCRGVPDRIFIYEGLVLFIEMKRAKQKPSALQLKHLNAIQKQNVHATWVDNVEDGKKCIDSLISGKILCTNKQDKFGPNWLFGYPVVPLYLMCGYLYEQGDSLLTDSQFDQLCNHIDEHWIDIKHPHKYLVDQASLKATTTGYIDWDNVPSMVKGAAIDALKKQTAKTLL